MRISVITVCFNSAKTIADTLRSVAMQTHLDVEHIVIDGGSSDGTLKLVSEHGEHVARLVSETDDGIYDAMNKGLALATGDLIAFLNSDDHYSDQNVLSDVATACESAISDFAYGDIRMVNSSGRTIRAWKTGVIPSNTLKVPQIPHPAFFVRKKVLDKIIPAFDSSYKIAADLKQQLIIIKKLGANGIYVSRTLVIMRLGGASTGNLASYLAGWNESVRAYNEVFGSGGGWFALRKVLSKIKGLRMQN